MSHYKMDTFVSKLPPPFPLFALPGETQGFALHVLDTERESPSLVEWNGEPLDKVLRVECWVENGNQYIYTERKNSNCGWSVSVFGEHPLDQKKVASVVEVFDEIMGCLLQEDPNMFILVYEFHLALRGLFDLWPTPHQWQRDRGT